jgi:hypothetical protein
MNRFCRYFISCLVAMAASVSSAQKHPYIGFVYPAGGQHGATFQVMLGGQDLDGVHGAFVSGAGVKARIVEYNKYLGNQEITLLNEQLRELKNMPAQTLDAKMTNLVAKLSKIIGDRPDRPANASIANIAIVEVTIASDAEPGEREIKLLTQRGISNPLVFNVGQVPEISAPGLPTSPQQVLGREEEIIRKKKRGKKDEPRGEMMMMSTMMTMEGAGAPGDLDDKETRVKLPCTVNGQIYSGTVDRFLFEARKGQRLVISAQARGLIPYLADAVPGWFQPVLALYNSKGKEVAYKDDYRFKPDPVILYEVSEDGEYMLAVYDAIYRGREDFIYRVTIGELPFLTGIFPIGGRVDAPVKVEMRGWNLAETNMTPDIKKATPGVRLITARGKEGFISNPMPFALDTLPECLENKTNNTPATAQKIMPPIIINGRVDKPGQQDVFRFEGRAGEEIVAEVNARRLDSPLDSTLKLTDAAGNRLAFNDDREDIGSGLNTHHADSYIRATLPSNGAYFVHLGDAQQNGGEDYVYRLRVSAPQPDFALRVVPSSVNIRSNAAAQVTVYAIRRDGFKGNIKLDLKNAPDGFEIKGAGLKGTQEVTRVNIKTSLPSTREPVRLAIEGEAKIDGEKIVREAVPADDRMQAFLWRHLVPAKELDAFVFDPPRPPPRFDPPKTNAPPAAAKP